MLYGIVFALYLFSFGLVFLTKVNILSKKYLIYFAPAISILFICFISIFSYIINLPVLIPVSLGLSILFIILNIKSLLNQIVSIDRLAIYSIFLFVTMFFLQNFIYYINYTNQKEAGDTWQIYKISRAVSPPDQTFSWHQARIIRNNISLSGNVYNDINFWDRPIMGGFLTNFVLYGQNLSVDAFPDTTFKFHNIFLNYMNVWWVLNNLVILGAALLIRTLLNKKVAIISTTIVFLSSFVLLINLGLWPKMLIVYLYSLVLVLHFKSRFFLLKGILASLAFWFHSSMLAFLVPLSIHDGILLIKSILYQLKTIPKKDKSGIKYVFINENNKRILKRALLFGVPVLLALSVWFTCLYVYKAPSKLAFGYLYDAGWTEVTEENKSKLIERFYESTNNLNLVLLPVMNICKNILPVGILHFIENFQYKDKGYVLRDNNIINSLARSEMQCILGILGVLIAPVIFFSVILNWRYQKFRQYFIYLYIIPTIILALMYRKDNIISNHITTPYILIVLISLSMYINKLEKNIFNLFIYILLILNNIIMVFLSTKYFSPLPLGPLILKPDHTVEWKWLIYIFILVSISIISVLLSKTSLGVKQRLG